MLTLDSEQVRARLTAAAAEAEREASVSFRQETQADYMQVLQTRRLEGGSAMDPERQLGLPLTPKELDKKLQKLNRKLRVRPSTNLLLPTTWYLEWEDPEGRLHTIAAMEGPVMPEWSRLEPHEEEVMDVVEHLTDLEQAAPRREAVSVREVVRGWRQVVLKAFDFGLLELEAMDREFGTAGRRSWAVHTGARSEVLRF